MKLRLFLCLFAMLLSSLSCVPQQVQSQAQPLTFWYDYTIHPGKEDEFMDLVKTVGQPVRDKLMADGVILAWGLQTPLLRVPGTATHTIWYVVNDYAGLEKVDSAMRAQIAKLNEEAAKSGAGKKGQKPAASLNARLGEIADMSKVHDYLTRDLVSGQYNFPPAGTLPYTRFNFFKVKPGKGADFRKAWEKYNKPVFEKLVADGVVLGYGFAVEEIRTEGEFTHFVWYDIKDLASLDKVRAAFLADRDRRSQEEQDSLTHLFASLQDPDASRSLVLRSLIFHGPTPK
jgi:NIPSNAP.